MSGGRNRVGSTSESARRSLEWKHHHDRSPIARPPSSARQAPGPRAAMAVQRRWAAGPHLHLLGELFTSEQCPGQLPRRPRPRAQHSGSLAHFPASISRSLDKRLALTPTVAHRPRMRAASSDFEEPWFLRMRSPSGPRDRPPTGRVSDHCARSPPEAFARGRRGSAKWQPRPRPVASLRTSVTFRLLDGSLLLGLGWP